MVQKKLPLINSAHGSETRNIINELIKLFNNMGYTYDEALKKAHDVLNEAKKTNDMNKNVQEQINTLVAESGTSDAEVLQARIDLKGDSHSTLKGRLDASEDRVHDTQQVINVMHHGAIGDGVTDDWAAIQGAITLAETMHRNVYLPGNDFYCSKTLRTAHKTTPHWSSGIRIFGDGKNTKIIGNGVNTVDYSKDNGNSDGAIFAIHGGNNIIENMTLSSGTVGVFYGQHPETEILSSVSFNTLENIWIERTGTGILMTHASGNNYNRFKKVHVLGAQIGVHLGKGIAIDRLNNNRNTFESIRVSYAWIAYLVEEADGNSFNGIYAENITSHGDVVGGRPSQLPQVLDQKHTSIVMLDGQYNFVNNFFTENSDYHLYSVGYRCTFDNVVVKDDVQSDLRVMFPDSSRQPLKLNSNLIINNSMIYQPEAGILYEGSNGTAAKGRWFDMDFHWQPVDLTSLSPSISSVERGASKIRRLGGLFSWFTSIRFTLEESLDATEDVKIDLPFNDMVKLDPMYTIEASSLTTFQFTCFTGTSGNTKEVKGRFSTNLETTENNNVPYIIIKSPEHTLGWDKDYNFNNISFKVDYYAENKK